MGNFLGALAGDLLGNTGSTSGTSTTSGQQSGSGSSQGSYANSTTPTENPLFSMFRQSLLPAIAGQFAQAQQDIYGPAQIAQVANLSNQNVNAANAGGAAADARSGRFNSGVSSANAAANRQAGNAQVTGFESQLPFLNQQAKMQNTNNLLGLATNFLGRAPLGQTSSGTSNNSFQQLMDYLSSTQSKQHQSSGLLGMLGL